MLRLSNAGSLVRNSQKVIRPKYLYKLNDHRLEVSSITETTNSRSFSFSRLRNSSLSDAAGSSSKSNAVPDSFKPQTHIADSLQCLEERKNVAQSAEQATSDALATKAGIRLSLAEWDRLNSASLPVPPKTQSESDDGVLNEFMMPVGFQEFRVESSENDDSIWDNDGLVDMGERRKFLRPGDLVELTNRGRSQFELAIFVQDVGVQSQFYTVSGRCIHALSPKVQFYVPDYIRLEDLDKLVPYLPDTAFIAEMLHTFQSPKSIIPRNVSKFVLQKMLRFKAQSEAIYQASSFKLDNAHELVAHENKITHAALQEIAEKVLPPTFVVTEKGDYEKEVLYAVHRALCCNDVGFRPHGEFSSVRAGGQYEISSKREIQVLAKVTAAVREQQEIEVARSNGARLPDSNLAKFAELAQRLIDRSRQNRDFTHHGTLSPWKSEHQSGEILRTGQIYSDFNHHEVEEYAEFIEFMELWAGLNTFSNNSQLNAWTFLQEIGSIPPWATLAPYEFRMPDTGRVLSWRTSDTDSAQYLSEDKLEDLREICESKHVYCIDDLATTEIDDGISLEATDAPDRYWVHIHVADPAAHLWDILDYKISPGRLRNVINILPSTVYELFLNNEASAVVKDVEVCQVGPDFPRKDPTRVIHNAQQLSDVHKNDLNILLKLGSARARQWSNRGGVMGTNAEPSVRVSFGGVPWVKPALSHSLRYPGDPSIKAEIPIYDPMETHYLDDRSQVVRNLMLLAGEVAGQWCAERGIPVPFRVTPHTGRNLHEFFVQNVLPSKNESGQFEKDKIEEYSRMIGRVQLSSSPGRHAQLGVDAMAKCTSPLRRYSDLLLHWQVEAALLEEARLGHSLVGNTREDFLPFGKAQVDAMLPRLDAMERFIRQTQGYSNRQWLCHLLVRAWKYKEVPLPKTWTFSVKGMSVSEDRLVGHVQNLDLPADCTIPDWPNRVNKGDLLKVEIEDINAYDMRLRVKALAVETSKR